jgi:hypothetical protein
MGVRQVYFSDLNGKEVKDPAAMATMTITFADKRRGVYELDITDEEATPFADKGRKISGPGVRREQS